MVIDVPARLRHLLTRSLGALALVGGSVGGVSLGGCGTTSGHDQTGGALNRPAAGRRAAQRPAAIAHEPLEAQVVRVVDGDTIDARLTDGAIQRVRLIGIDTPEKYTTRTGYVECGGEQASALTRQIAARWRDVTLRPDRSQDAYDTYGRLLAYVEPAAADDTTYQEAILQAGWARVYVYDHHAFTQVVAFRRAAADARRSGRGVWQRCGGDFQRPEGR